MLVTLSVNVVCMTNRDASRMPGITAHKSAVVRRGKEHDDDCHVISTISTV